MEPDHVSVRRLIEIVTHDNVPFTQEELDHVSGCADCFNRWREVIGTIPPENTDPADDT